MAVQTLIFGGGQDMDDTVPGPSFAFKEIIVDHVTALPGGLGSVIVLSHFCSNCYKACPCCVSVNGSSVDIEDYYRIIANQRSTEEESNSAEISTQTTPETFISALPDVISSTPMHKVQSVPMMVPPPPPPPPPPAPFPPPMFTPKNNLNILSTMKKKKDMKKQRSIGFNSMPLVITAEAIKHVKLRKPEERNMNPHSNTSPLMKRSENQPLVTLQDLQKVSLRKRGSSSCLSGHLRDCNITKKENTTTNVRQLLKKTSCKRSPGGTPVSERVKSANIVDENVTPIKLWKLKPRAIP